jgi:hypothetical protein
MRERRLETVAQYVADPEASATWYARVLGERFEFGEAPYGIPPGRPATRNDPDGSIIGSSDNSTGGMPGLAQD